MKDAILNCKCYVIWPPKLAGTGDIKRWERKSRHMTFKSSFEFDSFYKKIIENRSGTVAQMG